VWPEGTERGETGGNIGVGFSEEQGGIH
jgi:hypothetical protein